MRLIALAMVAAAPAAAQQAPAPAAPGAAASSVDPARLAAATQVIDLIMPPATRATMIEGMIRPMLANLRTGLAGNPQFRAVMAREPRAQTMFDRFMERQEARSMDNLRAALPGMTVAMARAYARRFTVDQLHEIRAFFETPTGRAYMATSFTIMADPDIAAWQRQTMAASMSHVQEDVAALAKDITALSKETGK